MQAFVIVKILLFSYEHGLGWKKHTHTHAPARGKVN